MKTNTREIIKKYNIKLTKSLGQNFLTDENIVRKIVDSAKLSSDDLVIEVGPGVGSMTTELATRAGKVVAIEIDKYLIPALTDNLKEFSNVEIVNKDILKVNFKDLVAKDKYPFRSLKVVANLPYYITTPIIMKLLEENADTAATNKECRIDTMVFMVQKEVADRMIAPPGGKSYGALSVAVQYFSEAEKVFDVPPACFIPQPDVYSTVIRLNIYKNPPVKVEDKEFFTKTVKAAFSQRRKTLVNALSNSGCFMQSKEEIKEILKNMGIGENQRGETLSILQFAELSNSFFQKNK